MAMDVKQSGCVARVLAEPPVYLLLAAGLIAAALILEHGFGYLPCTLCFWQRYPYYALLGLGGVYGLLRLRGHRFEGVERGMLAVIALAFFASGAIGLYHAGVEWRWWPGPARCSNPIGLPDDPEAAMALLGRVKIIPCDEPALKILGLSLAGWNAVIGLATALVAGVMAWRRQTGARHERSG